MNTLFNNLPDGFTILNNFLDEDRQRKFISLARAVAKISPFAQPTMRSGTPFKLQVTSCGRVGWFADAWGFRYLETHPLTRRPWAPMPPEFLALSRQAASKIGEDNYQPDTCLINYYPAATGRLGLHVDETEEDKISPIVTVSLGDSCIFAIGDVDPKVKPQTVQLQSGDVVIMHGRARLAYHGVEALLPETSALLKNGGRISLTFRKALNK